MMALINFASITTWTQLVLFAKDRLDASDSQVGVLFSAGSLGIVALSLAAGRIRKRLPFSTAALGALMLMGLLTTGLAAVTEFWLAVPLWASIAGLGLFFNVNSTSLRQAITPPHMLGRVMSIAGVLAWSANPLGALAGGWAIERTGNVALVYAGVGVVVFLIAFLFRFTALGDAERYTAEPAAATATEPA
jgi:MFS family permease